MRILVVVTFGGLSFWLTPLLILLIRSIQQRHAGLEFDSKKGLRLPPPKEVFYEIFDPQEDTRRLRLVRSLEILEGHP